MTRTLLVTLALALTALVSPSAAVAAVAPAPFHAYVRDWVGHTRSLHVRRDHTARESVSAGCCTPEVTLRLALGDVRGSAEHGSVRAEVVSVRVSDPAYFDARHPAPQVGDVARLRLRHGVLREPLTHTVYCDPSVAPRNRCGA